MKDFDPLNTNESCDEELLFSAKKREIKNILKSYVGMFDSFSELIQNSMDAVEKRAMLNEKQYDKRIWLKIDIR